ncbi:MAG: hypothetical protein NTV91_00995, partial [Proteobacteria bacterium]|nr:hypothetical protein [Pseudomonadota bacterium]
MTLIQHKRGPSHGSLILAGAFSMTHPHVPYLGAPSRTVRTLSMLVALVALSGCAAAIVTTGAVAVAGAGIGAVAKVAGAGIDAVVPGLSDYS